MRQVAIPIEEWLKLVDSGVDVPAMVTPKGNSMWPLIRGGKDTLEVKSLKSDEDILKQIKVGDIIIFRRADGAFVVHRIWKIGQSAEGRAFVQTYGDNCLKPDEPISLDAVCGIVTKIHRGDKTVDPSGNAAISIATANRSLAGMRHRLSTIVHDVKKD